MNSQLPEMCYSYIESTNSIALIKKGEKGFKDSKFNDLYKTKEQKLHFIEESNNSRGITKQKEVAMIAGALYGFGHSDADPGKYDDEGDYISIGKLTPYWNK